MSDRVALVTGGSTGIGESICRHFIDDGFEVLNLARRPAGFEHQRLHNFPIDLSDRAATIALAGELARRFDVDTLVHNAGLIRADLIEDVSLDDLGLSHPGSSRRRHHPAAGLSAGYERTRLRARRQYGVAGAFGARNPDQLCSYQGRHRRPNAHLGIGIGAALALP